MMTAQPVRNSVPGLWHTCLIRLFGGLLLGVSLITEAATYTLAVVPQATPAETHRRWAPFAEQVQLATGQPLLRRVRGRPDNGRVDFAYMNPYQFLMASKVQGYLPLVRDSSRALSGLPMVRRDSPLQSVQDLNGKVIAFPDQIAFAASLYMRALLKRVDLNQPVRVNAARDYQALEKLDLQKYTVQTQLPTP